MKTQDGEAVLVVFASLRSERRCRLRAAQSKYFCSSVVSENDVYSSSALGLHPD